MPRLKIDPLKRVLRKVFKTETCWYWLGCLSSHAYGKTSIGMRHVHSHTLVYELLTGKKVPKGLVLRHACDKPFCVNPQHLIVGTRSQNACDMYARGKWGTGSVWAREAALGFLAPFKGLKAKEVEASTIEGLPVDVADRIHKTETCWLWAGPNDESQGYGRVFIGRGKYKQAHQFVYEKLVGLVPKGLILRHSCDNPQCVNPEHLTPGTTKQNARDRQDRDRGWAKQGERHPEAKMSEPMAKFLLYWVATGRETQASIAKSFNISTSALNALVKGRTWKHIHLAR